MRDVLLRTDPHVRLTRRATTSLTERPADFDGALAVADEPVRVEWGA